jgi:alcohol dehydrogenase (cytochrome c)
VHRARTTQNRTCCLYGIGQSPGPTITATAARATTSIATRSVALDADTGKLKWHYQFTPHDVHDWDATECRFSRHADRRSVGKVVMFANRNGFYYTLDRTTGKTLIVASRRDDHLGKGDRRGLAGRCLLPGNGPTEKGTVTCPISSGGTNFWPPSFDPSTRTFFVNARESCMTFIAFKPEYVRASGSPAARAARAASESPAWGALRAIDPTTGERKWEFKFLSPSTSGS